MSCCNCNDITLKTQYYTLLLQYARQRRSVRVWECTQLYYMSMHSNISNSSSMYLKQRWNKIDNCASIETDRYYYYFFFFYASLKFPLTTWARIQYEKEYWQNDKPSWCHTLRACWQQTTFSRYHNYGYNAQTEFIKKMLRSQRTFSFSNYKIVPENWYKNWKRKYTEWYDQKCLDGHRHI